MPNPTKYLVFLAKDASFSGSATPAASRRGKCGCEIPRTSPWQRWQSFIFHVIRICGDLHGASPKVGVLGAGLGSPRHLTSVVSTYQNCYRLLVLYFLLQNSIKYLNVPKYGTDEHVDDGHGHLRKSSSLFFSHVVIRHVSSPAVESAPLRPTAASLHAQ